MSQISNLTSHPDSYRDETKNYAIIVAGGSGSRMQSAIPKQFMPLNGVPVLMHTMLAFYNSNAKPNLIVVLPQAYHNHWTKLCEMHDLNIPYQLVAGGDTRFHSVKNGLDLIPYNGATIAVQDAVRPLTSKEIIDESYQYATTNGNAVVAVKSRDSVRLSQDGVSIALNRDEVYLVQTPQTFQSVQLKDAYHQPYNANFTDDASVVEATGIQINLIEGSYQNIKITFPEDIAIAELLMKTPG
jgi:2-C-methyl-D-erythritol 4-phosphate cytidylyltransferase